MKPKNLFLLCGAGLAALAGVAALIITRERDPALLSFMFVLLSVGAYELWRAQTPGK